MKYVRITLVLLMISSLILIGFSKPEGESFGRGMNLVAYFFGSTILVWANTLILIVHLLLVWWRNRRIRLVISENMTETVLIVSGLIFPLFTALLIRLKSV